MQATIQFLLLHGSAVLVIWVFIDQIGLPIPAVPLLIAVGALAGRGQFPLALGIAEAVIASLAADLMWYELGRTKGHAILNLLCKISLEPDSCVRRSEEAFGRRGAKSLAFAKFIPGLSAAATPMAGLFGMRPGVFLAWDGAGALLWAGGYMALGFIFSKQIEIVVTIALRLGVALAILIILTLGFYILYRYLQRQRFIRSLRIARISPDELMEKIRGGEPLVIVDLRNKFEFDASLETLPGALRLLPEQLEERAGEIPRDRDVILYCT
ncbi:MAG: VTT domain-containing protein [Candidatus Dormibacteraceae bacterium]